MEPFELENEMLHHDIDYSPFEGMKFENWPRYTILRGEIIWDQEKGILGEKGFGQYLKRGPGETLTGRTGNIPRGMLEDERKYWL